MEYAYRISDAKPVEKLRFLRPKRLEDNNKMDFSEAYRGNWNFIAVRVRAKDIG